MGEHSDPNREKRAGDLSWSSKRLVERVYQRARLPKLCGRAETIYRNTSRWLLGNSVMNVLRGFDQFTTRMQC